MFEMPYFPDYKVELKILSFSQNLTLHHIIQSTVCRNSGCARWPRTDFMRYTSLKNLSKCFSTTLVSFEAATLDGLSKHHGSRRQEPRGAIRTHNIRFLFRKTPKWPLLRDMLIKWISNSRLSVTQKWETEQRPENSTLMYQWYGGGGSKEKTIDEN